MKASSFILYAAVLLVSFSSFTVSEDGSRIKKVLINTSFKKIQVEENIKIVLVPSASATVDVTISGDPSLVEKISIDVRKNKLSVYSDTQLTQDADLTVYIPVETLSEINLASGAGVSAEGYLHFEKLDVLFNIGSKVDLRVGGQVMLIPASDCEFVHLQK